VVKPWVREELQLAIEDALRIYALQVKVRDIELRMLKSAHLVAMGQVAAGIAHELMQPVAYVSQNVSSLRGDIKDVSAYAVPLLNEHPNRAVQQTLEELPSLVEEIDHGIKHIQRIAGSVKGQARGVDLEETSNIKEVVDLAVRMASAEVRERARIAVEGPSVTVKAGPVNLCQVLLNLIVNAAHALEGTGRKGLIEIRWKEEPDEVRCRVSDNGAGIKPENLERVFEPMFTTKPVGVGTGLGLPICRELMHSIGGDITLTSTLGQGTAVELRIPRPQNA
jgi:two-component system, NtrC family, sensor kinase